MMTAPGAFPSLWQAAGVVGLGFLPIAEGNVAVPVALALGMTPLSAVFLSVLGTTTQTLLVRGFARWLLTLPRIAGWWERRLSGRTGRLFLWKGSTWVVLAGIPWGGGGGHPVAGRRSHGPGRATGGDRPGPLRALGHRGTGPARRDARAAHPVGSACRRETLATRAGRRERLAVNANSPAPLATAAARVEGSGTTDSAVWNRSIS